MKTTSINIQRTIARVMSVIIVTFSLLMFIGEGIQSDKRGSGEPLTMNATIGLTLAGIGLLGLALAWKWEMTGGLICVLAFLALFIVNTDSLLVPMLIFPANGLLFIAVAYQKRKAMNQKNSQ